MTRPYVRLGIFAVVALTIGGRLNASADPVVVTFEGLQGDNLYVPNGYGGIDWLGGWIHYRFGQWPYTARSGSQRIYPTRGSVPIGTAHEWQFAFSGPDQLFQGAWFAGHESQNGIDAFIQFRLYDNGIQVASSSTLVPTALPTFLASGYTGRIDRVGVVSNTAGYWVMDDVTYGGDIAPVPEPGTWTLLGIGIVVTRWRSRRRGR